MSDYMDFGFLRVEPAPPNGRKVAIIGAGPSGLAATGYLACLGYEVHVYDKLPKAGGLMVFGIPGHRISSGRIGEGVRVLSRKHGVHFHLRTKICCSVPLYEEEGDHFSSDMRGLGDLRDNHDAVVICSGSWKSRKLGIEGENLAGVCSGLEFLFPVRAARYGAPNVSVPDVEGKTVVVIGAGYSAVDVAHTAVHLGARKVVLAYRRTKEEAPCGSFEIDQLQKMGVEWKEKVTPERVLGDGLAEFVEFSTCDGDKFLQEADLVAAAIGEIPTPPFSKELGLENVRKGEVRWLQMTCIENVFVAGDALTGPSKIGKAVYSGLRAARSLSNWLDLKAQNRQDEYRYDDLICEDASRFPGGAFRK